LIPLAFFFTIIGIVTFIVQFLIIITNNYKKETLKSQAETYLCLAVGIASIISYFIYVGMFIFLLIHRLRDSSVLNSKSEILIKNQIKSID